MSLPALRKFVLPPVIASAAVFSLMSSPLAVLGDKPVNIRFEEEPIFDGRLRDIAPPYVGLVTLLSLGTGVAAAAIGGWRSSARHSEKLTSQISLLEETLSEKDALLKELKMSESRLQISGLTGFLDEEVPFDRTMGEPSFAQAVSQPVVAQTATVIQPKVITPSLPVPVRDRSHGRVNSALDVASSVAASQTYMRYAPSSQVNTNQPHHQPVTNTSITSEEFEELQQQMRLMMEKMQQMQNHLQATTPVAVASSKQTSDRFQVYYDSPTHNEGRYM